MRTNQSILLILVISIVFSFVNLSCNSVKTAVSCPEISIKKNNYRAHRKVRNSHALFAHKTSFKNQNKHRSKKIQNEEIKNLNLPVAAAGRSIQISKVEFTSGLMATTDNTFHPVHKTPALIVPDEENKYINDQYKTNIQEVKCDTIFLKSGAIIIGKVEEIGQSELKYRRCNNLTGPVISVLKSDVARINYSNGTNELFGPNDFYIPNQTNFSNYNSVPLKTEGLGLAGFISGLVGLFIASIPLGIIAVVFGSISLSKIKKNPQRYKGRGFAIASIIIGIVEVVGMIILLGAML